MARSIDIVTAAIRPGGLWRGDDVVVGAKFMAATVPADEYLIRCYARPFGPPPRWRNQLRIIRDATQGWNAVRRAAATWMRRPYSAWLDEGGYRDVPRGVLIEPFLGDGPALPIDYKLYVFHGRVEAIQVHVDRETRHRRVLFDRDWQGLPTDADLFDSPPPSSLPLMIEGAEVLGSALDFVRVDFYEVGAVPRFGEMTFYPGWGLDPFDPPRLDAVLGDRTTRDADRTLR